jgi:deoxycytidylate deaminase
MSKLIDLTNKKFGRLTVINRGHGKITGKDKRVCVTWVCKCDCGAEVEVVGQDLKNGTTSCGCYKKEYKKYNSVDLIGQTFGKLTVISKTDKYTKTRGVIWRCKCECSNEKLVPTNGLTSGNYISCGCSKFATRCGEIPHSHFNAIFQNAIKRNYEFSVSIEYLLDLFISQDRKCKLTGMKLIFTDDKNPSLTRSKTTASLDRIDSNKGYIEGNVQWVHKDINKMKNNHSTDKFIDYCQSVVNYSYFLKNRPSWDEYFLLLSFDISLRSEDPNIKHGAIIVNSSNHIIGTGYNNPIRGANNDLIPLNIRDEKRKWMIHAEENAILNCISHPSRDQGITSIYITGLPCNNCLQRIINFGIKRIIIADRPGSITEDSKSTAMKNTLIQMSQLELIKIPIQNVWIQKNLQTN